MRDLSMVFPELGHKEVHHLWFSVTANQPFNYELHGSVDIVFGPDSESVREFMTLAANAQQPWVRFEYAGLQARVRFTSYQVQQSRTDQIFTFEFSGEVL